MNNVVFIVGSPRSGTSLLGDLLALHPQIGRWFEPYFVLDRYFRDSPHDCRTAADATDEVQEYVVKAFEYYRTKRGCDIIVDKSPRNSVKIPFLNEIFPKAKFIHILRDGRDATLSIQKKWQKTLHGGQRNLSQVLKTIKSFLDQQPLLVHKLAALSFEVGSPVRLVQGHGLLHRERWRGHAGWGPRFEGWQMIIDQVSSLQFNALQWVKCVEAVVRERRKLANNRFFEIRYEDLLRKPQETLAGIFEFLEVPLPENFMFNIPSLKYSNFGKWQTEFGDTEKAQIGPILHPLLIELGYAGDDAWYESAWRAEASGSIR